ncbi:MAG: MBG domain-containing protein [Bacteroidales bacterium]|nr:MBG domain-containing protein [Bacteroidales bacterium]
MKNRPDVQLGCNVNLNYKINKAPLTVVVDNVSREYGEPNPAFSNQFTISGFVGGEDKSVIDVMPALGCDATQRSDAGEYPIKCSGGTAKNYEFVANTTGTLTVTKAPLEATVADSERTYGEENPAFMLHDYVGLRNGDTDPGFESAPEFSTVADKESPVGSYDVSATGGSMKNYAFASLKSGTLTVNPATLTVTADNASRLYREENPALTFTVEGWRNGQDNSAFTQAPELSTTATLTSDAGEYPIEIAKTAVAPNYAISYVDGTLTVDKRDLTVSADDCQRPYGEENPEFAISYQGFAGDDDASVLSEVPVATTTATAKSDVGTYPIEISGGEAKNYNVTYNPGTLTIVKAEQEIMWEQDLSNLVQDDLVLLTAVATSGLPITYTVTDNNVCDIFVRGDEQYLDCIGVGETRVRANQAGNNNYEPAFREVKHVMIAAVPDKPVLTIRSLPMGEASFAVDKGTTLKIKLAAQSGWKINSVTVDDEDYTAELSQSRNVLTTPAINADMQVVITYEESAVTDRADLMSDRGDIRVLGRGDGIRVTGAPEGETVSIYNVDGMLIKSERIASSTAHDISLQTGEIYIVAIASRTFKLRI